MKLDKLEYICRHTSKGKWIFDEINSEIHTREGGLIASCYDSKYHSNDALFISTAHDYFPMLIELAKAIKDLKDDPNGPWLGVGVNNLIEKIENK